MSDIPVKVMPDLQISKKKSCFSKLYVSVRFWKLSNPLLVEMRQYDVIPFRFHFVNLPSNCAGLNFLS